MYSIMDDKSVNELINKIIEDHFPSLMGCVIEPIFTTKKKTSKGKIVLAVLSKPNSLVKHIFGSVSGNELDYILIIDLNVFYVLEEKDKRTLLTHALEFADVDLDKANPYNLRGAEVETFYDEIDRTKDDPQWQNRFQSIAENVYDKE